MAIAANAQQWYKKPVAMGGGGGTFTGYVLPEKFSATPNCGTITVTGNNYSLYCGILCSCYRSNTDNYSKSKSKLIILGA